MSFAKKGMLASRRLLNNRATKVELDALWKTFWTLRKTKKTVGRRAKIAAPNAPRAPPSAAEVELLVRALRRDQHGEPELPEVDDGMNALADRVAASLRNSMHN